TSVRYCKYVYWTVFFCRFFPLILSFFSIPPDMSNINLGIFLLLTTLGTLILNIVLVYLGASLGASWKGIVKYMELLSKIVYILLFSLLITLIYIFIGRRRNRS